LGADRKPSLDATIASLAAYEKVGVDVIEMGPLAWCTGPNDLDKFFDVIVAAKGAAS